MKVRNRRARKTTHDRAKFHKKDLQAAVADLRGAVSFDASLRDYTSFKIGGPADVLVEPADVDDVRLLLTQAQKRKIPVFVVGGTNLLIRDGGIRGIVVSLAKLRTIREEPGHVLYAEGGVGMPTLIGYAIRRSLAGLEWAAGIPGTVGGCVVMNAGTRLGEMKDSVKAVRLVTIKGEVKDLPAAAIPFEYRRARLPKGGKACGRRSSGWSKTIFTIGGIPSRSRCRALGVSLRTRPGIPPAGSLNLWG
jgi:UDP-N-acetylmuramate dehydrogenase